MEFGDNLSQILANASAEFRVECTEWFVQEKNTRVPEYGAADGNTLLLASTQRGRTPIEKWLEIQNFDRSRETEVLATRAM